MAEVRQRAGKSKKSSDKDDPQTGPPTAASEAKHHEPSRMHRIFGFDWSDFSSWTRFVELLYRPTDPSGLAAFRIGFGLLMSIDIIEERGLSQADYKWGDPDECRFPLFHFMRVPPIEWIYMIYLVMLVGALGILFGLFFRLSCLLFAIPYWFVFLSDKIAWNNHSYLYGLTSLLFLFTDANRYWSLDGLLRPKIRNSHVPLCHHAVFRTQYFLVYFIAGLKKLDSDWVSGYSMSELSKHWVFAPFTMLMGNEMVDLVIVHWGGLALDLFVGYLLFFDKTRPIAFFFGSQFHLMNSQLFSIGMFPWTMLWSNFLFCHTDWLRRFLRKLPSCLSKVVAKTEEPQTNDLCLYQRQPVATSAAKKHDDKPAAKSSGGHIRWRHYAGVLTFVGYLSIQCFMPYSHFVTKGYNNWTNGLYGYSWDMMVHSWSTQHIRITYKDKITGEVGYLNPMAWSRSRKRWSSHADMLLQYSTCVQDHLVKHGHPDIEIYFDIWRSLNDRFQQRMFDPRVDILTAEWHPFKPTPWLLPLLTDLSDWRGKLADIERNIYNTTNDTDVVFVADFPGLSLENYIQEELNDTRLLVLKGEVMVEIVSSGKNTTLTEGQEIRLPGGEFHNVHTVSTQPSCYMYTFVNQTEIELMENITAYEKMRAAEADASPDNPDMASVADQMNLTPEARFVMDSILYEKEKLQEYNNRTLIQSFTDFIAMKIHTVKRSAFMTSIAIQSVISGREMAAVFNESVAGSDEQVFSVFTS